MIRPGQRRTPPCPLTRRSATCVPFMGSDRWSCQVRLAQWLEHQTDNLAVTGSTPVPTPQAENLPPSGPREAGQRVIGHRRPATGGAEDSGHSVPWGGSRRNRRLGEHAAAGGSTAECHVVRGYRFHRPSASGNGCLATRPRALPRGDEPGGNCRAAAGYVDAQTTLRTWTCDRRWFRRLMAFVRHRPLE